MVRICQSSTVEFFLNPPGPLLCP
uniref:Uncharacterized protein n=1 Tax=Anguilla anguilla TaxID=7936 RepID=A0A0E9PQV8_ANGAN